jgi:predicted nuclease of predicted toxin-antitoxin system
MRLIADENFPKSIVDRLRLEDHDLIWAGTDVPTAGDASLLDRAEDEGRILLTLDRDFWQLAVQRKRRLRRSGVILFRVHPATPTNVERPVQWALQMEETWIGQVALVTPEGIDIVPAGRS